MPECDGERSAQERLPIRLLAAGGIGTSLEFYDLTVYGLMATTLAPLFFPSDNEVASLIASFAAFAVGMSARVGGGIVFGWVADRFDRRSALLTSILLMAFSCGLLALLPSYGAIGVAAPILLLILRMMQGFAVGGELGVSYVYIGEQAGRSHRGFAMSAVGMGTVMGIILGAVVVGLLHLVLRDDQFNRFGWRIAFGLGVVVAFVGFIIRKRLVGDTEAIHSRTAFWPAVVQYSATILCNIAAMAGIAGSFFALFFFAPALIVKTAAADGHLASTATLMTAFLVVLFMPVFGFLCDRIGGREIAAISALALGLLTYPMLSSLFNASQLQRSVILVALALLVAGYIASIAIVTFEIYPREVRGSCFSIVFNIAYGVVGGTAPMIAAWVNSAAGSSLAFAWYLAALCIVSAIMLQRLKPLAPD